MRVDQAAGLRRHLCGQTAALCVQCVGDSADCALRLAHVFHRAGRTPLVVDACGRLFARDAPRALFDWPRQIEQGRLLTLPLDAGTGWHAPGVRADAPGLERAVRAYDVLIFDSAVHAAAAGLPGARPALLLAVRPATLYGAYALLKTRAAAGPFDAILYGDAAACARVRAACARYLGAAPADAVACARDEDDAITTLAARMTGEERGLAPEYIQTRE